MVITFNTKPRRPSPVERETERVTGEFFRHWPERRPASELEVLLLSEALGCGESVIRSHLTSPSKPKAAQENRDSWRLLPGSRGERGLMYWPQLERVLRACDELRQLSALERRRARTARDDLDALVSHSEAVKSVLQIQTRKAAALLEKARLGPGGDAR